jgi:hypothetical protein
MYVPTDYEPIAIRKGEKVSFNFELPMTFEPEEWHYLYSS